MNDQLLELVKEPVFWGRLAIGLGIWYISAYAIARVMFNNGKDALAAVRLAPFLALLSGVAFAAIGMWVWWKDMFQTIVLGTAIVVIPILISTILLRIEPAAEL